MRTDDEGARGRYGGDRYKHHKGSPPPQFHPRQSSHQSAKVQEERELDGEDGCPT